MATLTGMSEIQPIPDGFQQTYERIRAIFSDARARAYRAINTAMVAAYWEIGRVIVEQEQQGQQRAEYGKGLLVELSQRLTAEFGKGFDRTNLWHMRAFLSVLSNSRRTASRIVLDPLPPPLASGKARGAGLLRSRGRQLPAGPPANWNGRFTPCCSSGWRSAGIGKACWRWPRRDTKSNNQATSSKTLMSWSSPACRRSSDTLESDLEQALIDKLREFLLELGKGFAFMARQQRITIDGQHYWIDLVFYNRLTRSFVLIDLKVGTLTHQDLGQMQMYVNYYQREITAADENPPIGIVLCADKSEAVVRYTLPEDNQQIFASRYKLYLPTETELAAELQRERQAIEMEGHLRKGPD